MTEFAIQTEEELKKRALTESGITYSLCGVIPALISLLFVIVLMGFGGADKFAHENWYLYLGYLLPQLCFAAAALIFFRRSKVSFTHTFAPCKWYYFLLAVGLQFGLMFSLSELNGLFISLLELMGYRAQSGMLPYLGGWNILPALLVVALLPAFFEEIIFRGILTKQMHENGWGLLPTVLISGALFSLFHHSPEQTLYQFACGVCFALVAIRSGSVLPTMLAHFLNNAVILSLSAGFYPSGENWGLTSILPVWGYVVLVVVSALCLAGSLFCLLYFNRDRGNRGRQVVHGKTFFFAAAVGIGLCAFEWIFTLVNGFIS